MTQIFPLLKILSVMIIFILPAPHKSISQNTMSPNTTLTCLEKQTEKSENQLIPRGAQNLAFLTFTCTAHQGPVTIKEITFAHLGVGTTSDLSKLYLYENSIRLTSGFTLSSETNSVTIHNIGKTLQSEESLTLTLIGGIEPNAALATQHGFQIKNEEDIHSTASKVEGFFPIGGSTLSSIGS